MQFVYAQVFPKVRAYILKNSGDEEHVKDIFQEAYINCWRNIKEDKIQTDSNIEGYLMTIAKNKWTDYLRSSSFKNKSLEIGQLSIVSDEITINEKQVELDRTTLRKALEQMGEACKKVLQLFYFERKSMNDIALELKITSASARNQKYRCMEKLRNTALELKNNG